MKKLVVISTICLFALMGCTSKESVSQKVFVTVYEKASQDAERVLMKASTTTVMLFKDEGKEVDNAATANNLKATKVMTYIDGTVSGAPAFHAAGTKLYFEQVPNGKYILWIYHLNGTITYASCKPITVNSKLSGKIQDKTFMANGPLGYREWVEVW